MSLTQEATEGDGRRQGSKVDEDDGSQDLGAECICDVTQIVRITAPDVTYQASKDPACPL